MAGLAYDWVCCTASAQVPLARRDGSWWECPKLQVQPNFNVCASSFPLAHTIRFGLV
jgi:hypothetical protein